MKKPAGAEEEIPGILDDELPQQAQKVRLEAMMRRQAEREARRERRRTGIEALRRDRRG